MISSITLAVLAAYALSAWFRFDSNRCGVLCAIPFVAVTYVISFSHVSGVLSEIPVRILYFFVTLAWVYAALRLRLILQSIPSCAILIIDTIMFIDSSIFYFSSNYISPIYGSYPNIMLACHLAVAASLWGEGNVSVSRPNRRNNDFNNSKDGGEII